MRAAIRNAVSSKMHNDVRLIELDFQPSEVNELSDIECKPSGLEFGCRGIA